ncbi:hypothetical protein [Burkholderia multivorans]|uniref:hypothetical protein n=1 Tax=Burkholderia multivorans TaxID=87883 RepID=UPI001E38A0D5|nr:hypothetical protein [Burkholderia multivorans]
MDRPASGVALVPSNLPEAEYEPHMEPSYSLCQMRAVWIDAYLNGDVDQLNFVESPHFFVKRGTQILTKSQQLAHLQRHASEQTRRNCNWHAHGETTEYAESGQWASIRGAGSMLCDGKTVSAVNFFELWLVDDNRWQIAALCYDERENDDGVVAGRSNESS